MFERCSAAALVSLSGAVDCRRGVVAGGERPNWGLGAGVRRGEAGQSSGILEARRAERRGGDERNEAFGGGAGAANAANPMRASAR